MVKKQSGQRKQSMRLRIKCPNCGLPSVAYKVKAILPTLTELTQECTNENCKMRFVSYVEADRILQLPQVIVNTEMKLPLSQLSQQKRILEYEKLAGVSNNESDLDMIKQAMPQRNLFYEATPVEVSHDSS